MIYEGKDYIVSIDGKEFHCVLDVAMNYIGGKWKAIILWYLKDGIKRFGELRKLIPDITERMLTLQLRELEKDGFVLRTLYPQVPPKVEYSLTTLGLTLIPILKELVDWGAKISHERGKIIEVTGKN
jgi:DNA-binding HxlR family transcriptional regulator